MVTDGPRHCQGAHDTHASHLEYPPACCVNPCLLIFAAGSVLHRCCVYALRTVHNGTRITWSQRKRQRAAGT
jgi:hypothetical protein